MRTLERAVLFIPLASLNGVAMTSTIVPLRLTVVDNDSLHQTVTSFPSLSGMAGLPYIMMRPFTDEEFKELPHVLWTSEDDWDPTSLDSVISDDPNLYKAEPSPPLPDPMYDEYGEFRGHVLINQHEWQVHYFDALDTKLSSDNNEFHDALAQFADDPDSVINLIVYHANRVHYVCNHETVEAAPKFLMTSEPDYGRTASPLSQLVAY
jgi:hypothetical protein